MTHLGHIVDPAQQHGVWSGTNDGRQLPRDGYPVDFCFDRLRMAHVNRGQSIV
jgi:hypothetical protein